MCRWLSVLLLVPTIAAAQAGGQLPAYLLQLPDSVKTVLVAETSRSALHRIKHGPDGAAYADERYMSIGQNGVGKQRAWDRRTPLGIYFVTDELDTTRLHEKYGPVAFPLDYPNIWDRINKRSGDGIWIHGVDESAGRRPPLDTDGCIALPNQDILAIEAELLPVITPVIIARQVRWVSPEEIAATRDALKAELATWANSVETGDLHRYLSMYAKDFGYRGMTRDEWAHYRTGTLGAMTIDDFVLEDVLLLADPEESGLFLSRFRQIIVEAGREIVTTKRLYWRRTETGFEIVAEDDG